MTLDAAILMSQKLYLALFFDCSDKLLGEPCLVTVERLSRLEACRTDCQARLDTQPGNSGLTGL